MKIKFLAALVAIVLGASSVSAVTLWTGWDDGKASGLYWPLGDSGMALGTFAGINLPSDPNSDNEEFGVSGGFVSLDGIPVMGGVELGLEVSKAAVKDSGYDYAIVLGKGFLFDLTDEVAIGWYLDLLRYSASTKSDTESSITLLGNMYPVVTAEVTLW